jgi:hypothetical protein
VIIEGWTTFFFLHDFLPPHPPNTPPSTNFDLILTLVKNLNVFFHGSASICTIILCCIPFWDLVMVLYELKRNQVIRDCCGTWFTSYLAQLAHPLHNFHLEEGKMPKQPWTNGLELKSYDVLQEMHIELSTLLAFLQLELHFQSIAPPSLCQ